MFLKHYPLLSCQVGARESIPTPRAPTDPHLLMPRLTVCETALEARRAGISYRYLFMHPSGSDLAQIAELIENGKLRVILDKAYPVARISEALAYVESGRAKGKVVATLS